MDRRDKFRPAYERLTDYLHSHHLRMTYERSVILQHVCQIGKAFTPGDLITHLQGERISDATVYNTVSLFLEANILHNLVRSTKTSQVYYELALEDKDTILIICPECGRRSEVRDPVLADHIRGGRYSNFIPSRFVLQVYGKCRVCRNKQIWKKDSSTR